MRKLVILFCIVLHVTACNKTVDTGGDLRLSRILVNGQLITEFIYGDSGRLLKTLYYTSPTGLISMQATNTYDSKGLLVKTETIANISSTMTIPKYDTTYVEMVYGADRRISETKHFNRMPGIWQQASRVVYDYDAQGRLSATTMYAMNSNTPGLKHTYQYNAANNVGTEEYYQYNSTFSGLVWRRQYEYDQHKNPYRDMWVMPYGANLNNITRITGTSFMPPPPGAPQTNGPSIFTSIYKQYNSAGYPTLVNESGVDYVYEYH